MIIRGNTIDDVWRTAIFECVRHGKDYVVKQGSYEGQVRRQFPYVVLEINTPNKRPLAVQMPEGSGLPAPTTEERIGNYFVNYLMTTTRGEYDYTYGQFITKQLERILYLLLVSEGNTNQACIGIGRESSCFLNDPPCLRSISFKVIDKKLQMAVYFRSWDLFAGLPENLGGLQLLKEYVLACLQRDIDIEDGSIIAFSDGLHLYEMYFPLVNILSAAKIE